MLAVRWSLRFALSYRDAEELLAERGIQVDHTTVSRRVQRFTPLLAHAAHRCFQQAIDATKVPPAEVVTDKGGERPGCAGGVAAEGVAPHRAGREQPRRVRSRPVEGAAGTDARGSKKDGSAKVVIAGHALVQNVRRGHYELAIEAPARRRVAVAFDELAMVA